ncbi:MAG: putative DNA binding domain-containing protein [Clostridia bacterium]|nr:putative DNA binding domain-containing protein [Clostridia bacterium]
MNLGKENEQLEFKKSTSEIKEAMDDICAILNKHGSGVLYFGIKPNGDVCGQEVGILTLDDIARACKESIYPMIYPSIKEVDLDGCKCIKVIFSGSEKPYSSNGIFYKRVVDRSEKMTPDEIKSVMASTDYSSKWENNLTNFGIEDIDYKALKSYYDESISCGRLEPLSSYNEKELLVGLGLLENEQLTNAGYYLFSNKKPVALKIATYVTDERINFSDIRRIEDNIYNLIRYANSYIKDKINWRVETGNGTSRIEIPEIPVEAIREIVVNSFAHANYRGITEHEIAITPTRIEIYNPGEFPINLNPEMFALSKRKSQPRNKVILNTLFKSKDVEIFGSGFKKVYSYCKDANVKFDYDLFEDGFSFVFYRSNFTLNVTNNVTLKEGINLTTNDYKILNLLKNNPNQTREQLASKIGVNKRTVQRSLDKLVSNGSIVRVGSKKTGYWEVIK